MERRLTFSPTSPRTFLEAAPLKVDEAGVVELALDFDWEAVIEAVLDVGIVIELALDVVIDVADVVNKGTVLV
jgi:hypothetical protein